MRRAYRSLMDSGSPCCWIASTHRSISIGQSPRRRRPFASTFAGSRRIGSKVHMTPASSGGLGGCRCLSESIGNGLSLREFGLSQVGLRKLKPPPAIIFVRGDGSGAHGRHRHRVAHGAPIGGAMTLPHRLLRIVLLKHIYLGADDSMGSSATSALWITTVRRPLR
jgi:hypothetical protein